MEWTLFLRKLKSASRASRTSRRQTPEFIPLSCFIALLVVLFWAPGVRIRNKKHYLLAMAEFVSMLFAVVAPTNYGERIESTFGVTSGRELTLLSYYNRKPDREYERQLIEPSLARGAD